MPIQRLIVMALVVAPLACQGGGGSPSAPVALSWRFVDGRPCDLAAVVDVIVRSGADDRQPPTTYRCAEGLAPDHELEHSVPTRPSTLVLDGVSITGALMYRGERTIEREAGTLQPITLYFVGGSP